MSSIVEVPSGDPDPLPPREAESPHLSLSGEMKDALADDAHKPKEPYNFPWAEKVEGQGSLPCVCITDN